MTDNKESQKREKDFSYSSGERQTATDIHGIRPDHSSRYEMAEAILHNNIKNIHRPLVGLDVFCGNGYGSWLLSKTLNAFVTGIDGSNEAIQMADAHYSTGKTLFSQKFFPFELPSSSFDFITCFESIEHVKDPKAMFETLADALRGGGLLFVSTPNEDALPFSVNAAWFQFHVQHFNQNDIAELTKSRPAMTHAARFGQNVYRTDASKRVLGVDNALDMRPTKEWENAQFIIHVFTKKP